MATQREQPEPDRRRKRRPGERKRGERVRGAHVTGRPVPGEGEDLEAQFRADQHLPQEPVEPADDQTLVGESETSSRRSGTRGQPHGRRGPSEDLEGEPLIDPLYSNRDRRAMENALQGPVHSEPPDQEPAEAGGGTGEPEETPAEHPGAELDEDEIEVRAALEPPDLDDVVDDVTDDESLRKSPSELANPRRGASRHGPL